mgnify:FL=1
MKREEMKASLMRYHDAIVRERQMAEELRQLRIRRRMLEQCQGAEAADAAQSIGKLEQEIARNVEESLRTRGEVLALIGQIQDPSENAVLVLHYINGDSLERVGEKMDRSERWARDKHTQALDRLCGL